RDQRVLGSKGLFMRHTQVDSHPLPKRNQKITPQTQGHLSNYSVTAKRGQSAGIKAKNRLENPT
ncbi:MAG: hypothetical protein ABI240_06690, partial [Sphingomonas sp.]